MLSFAKMYVFLLRGFGAFITFLSGVVISRLLGVENSGYYFLVVNIITILSVVANFGYGTYILKFSSCNDNKNEIANDFYLILYKIFKISIVVISIAFFLSDSLATFLHKEEVSSLIYIMSFSILFIAINNVQNSLLQGVGKFNLMVFLQNIINPLFMAIIVLIVFYFFNGVTKKEVAIFYLIVCMITSLIGFLLCNRIIPKNKKTIKKNIDSKDFFIINFMTIILLQGVSFVCSKFIDISDYSLIISAQRITNIITFIYTSLLIVYIPFFTKLYFNGNVDELKKETKKVSRRVFFVGGIVVFILYVFSSKLMSLYGNAFIPGYKYLDILLYSQLINLITFTSTNILTMCGYEKIVRRNFLITMFLSLFLSIVLSLTYGAEGAVVAIAVSICFQNLLSFFSHRKKMGYFAL